MENDATRRRLLTVPETAERIKQHRSSIYRKIERGDLPAVQLGGPRSALRVDERAARGVAVRPGGGRVSPQWTYHGPGIGYRLVGQPTTTNGRFVPAGDPTTEPPFLTAPLPSPAARLAVIYKRIAELEAKRQRLLGEAA